MIHVREQRSVVAFVAPKVSTVAHDAAFNEENEAVPEAPLPYAQRKHAYTSGWFDFTCFVILVLLLLYALI